MKRYKFFISLIGLSVFTSTLQAQVSIGAKAGVNISQIPGFDVATIKDKALFGFHAGAYAHIKLGFVAVQPELLYSTQGARLEQASGNKNLNLNYFNVPIMIKFQNALGLYAETGPQFGFVSGAKFGDDDIKETIKSADFAWGAGIGWQTKHLGIGVRYNIGLTSINDMQTGNFGNADYKNGVLQASLYIPLLGGK